MKIVFEYIETDDCTYFIPSTFGVEFESTEALYLKFCELEKSARDENVMEFKFYGINFRVGEEHPDFYTIDEWFEKGRNIVR